MKVWGRRVAKRGTLKDRVGKMTRPRRERRMKDIFKLEVAVVVVREQKKARRITATKVRGMTIRMPPILQNKQAKEPKRRPETTTTAQRRTKGEKLTRMT